MSDSVDDSSTRVARLEAVVRDVLAPLVARDQGELEFVGVDRGVVEVRLGGACAGCPGQPYTTRSVLLPALRAVDPTITQVRVRPAF